MHAQTPTQRPFLFHLLLALGLFALVLLRMQAPAGAADVTGQLSDNQLTSGDLGVATRFVNDSTIVHTPDGDVLGPDGVSQFMASLQQRFPDAEFTSGRVQAVNDLLIIDWHGTIDGQVIIPGRTMITIDDGAITNIWFLNLNSIAPVGGEPFQQSAHDTNAAVSVYYELPYEQGRPVVVETELASEEPAWPGLAPSHAASDQTSITGPVPESFATDSDQDAR